MSNMAEGRLAKCLEEIQVWSKEFKYGKRKEKRRYPKETIAQPLVCSVLFKYMLWNLQSSMVAEKELPVEQRVLMEEVGSLKDTRDKLEVRYRGMFL